MYPMIDQNKLLSTDISLFDNFPVRKIMYKDERYFSIVDVVIVLTDSPSPRQYRWKVKQREFIDLQLSPIWVQLKLESNDGKKYFTDCANTENILRIIQSIPSPKAEPFKQRLSSLGNERIEEVNNPELGMIRSKERAIELRKRQWHDDKRITKRIQSLDTRNAFTDLLKNRGIKEWFEYALLTNKVYSIGLWVSWWVKEYKEIKWLKKNDNLRDHMDNLEIALVDLAEAGSQKIMEEQWSKGFEQVQDAVITWSEIAWNARKNIEDKIGKSIISDKNYLTDNQKNKRIWLDNK